MNAPHIPNGIGDNYSWALEILEKVITKDKIQLIAEIGSRDGMDAIALAGHFEASAIIFEPDPINFKLCSANLRLCEAELNLKLLNIALSDFSGEVDFFSIDPSLYGNRGASALYQISFDGRPLNDPDRGRASVQRRTSVEAFRFDELRLPTPDLIAMDAEGSELSILRGFGDKLKEVKVVITESSFWNYHKGGGSTFVEIDRLLSQSGFQFLASNQQKSDGKFPKQSLAKLLFHGWQPAFDVIYVNSRYQGTSN